MATWNTPANRRRAAWVLAAVPAWAVAAAAAFGAAYAVLVLFYEAGFSTPAPAWELPPFLEIVLLCVAGWTGVLGPLVGLAAGAAWGWPWPRSALAAAGPGFAGAAGLLAAGPGSGGFVMSVMLAHLGLFAGMAGAGLAYLRARVERPIGAAPDDDDE